MNTVEALRILNNPEPNKQSVLKHYRQQAKRYHPDCKNGDLDIMKLVNLAFELVEGLNFTWDIREEDRAARPLTDTIQEMWDQLKHYPGLVGEIIGSWLWISGNTYPIREQLKNMGFSYAHIKKCWYYHEGYYHKHNKTQYTMSDMRNLWGSQTLEEEQAEAIAAS